MDCSYKGHKSCFNCTFVRVGHQPFRECILYKDKHMWFDSELEIKEDVNENGRTFADDCPSWKERKTSGYIFLQDIHDIISERKRLEENDDA